MQPTDEVQQARVKVTSGGWQSGDPGWLPTSITINDVAVEFPLGILGGYNVASIDPANGTVTTARFDVFHWAAHADHLVSFIDAMPEGHLFAAAIAGDGYTNLSDALRSAFVALGSQHIRELQFRNPWAFLSMKGRPEVLLQEAIAASDTVTVSATISLRSPPRSTALSVMSSSQTTDIGYAVTVVDPITRARNDRFFHLSEVPSLLRLVDGLGDGQIALIGVHGGAAGALGPMLPALRSLGAARFDGVHEGASYALVGRKGAMPGSVPEATTYGSAIGLAIQLDDSGGWMPSLLGLVYPERNYGGQPLALTGATRSPIAGGSLWLSPGTGATVVLQPGDPGIDCWGSVPDLSVMAYPGASAQLLSLRLWPTAGRPAPSRTFPEIENLPGAYLIPHEGNFSYTRDGLVQECAVQIIRREPFAPGRWHGEVAGQLAPEVPNGPLRRGSLFATGERWLGFTAVADGDRPDALIINDEGEGRFSLSPPSNPSTWLQLERGVAGHPQWVRQRLRRPGDIPREVPLGRPRHPGGVASRRSKRRCIAAGRRGPAQRLVPRRLDRGRGPAGLRCLEHRQPSWPGPPWVRSVRCGPHTAVRLFRDKQFGGEMLEISGEMADLPAEWQDKIGSIQLRRLAQPSGVPMDVSVVLSDDLHLQPDGTLVEAEVYRTTLALPANVGMVEIRATADTQVRVGPATYPIGPDQGAVLRPNAVRRLVVTSDATALGTVGLLFRADTMRRDEWFPVFPDRFVHTTLASLQDVADAAAAPFAAATGLDAHGQRAVGHVMGAIAYADVDTVIGPAHGRAVSSQAMDHPGWQLALPVQGKRSVADFTHFTNDAALDAAIAGALDGDADGGNGGGNDRTRAAGGQWNAVLAGAYDLHDIVVHKAAPGGAAPLRAVVRYVEQGTPKLLSFALHSVDRLVQLGHLIVHKVGAEVHRIIGRIKLVFSWPDVLRTQRQISSALSAVFAAAPGQIQALRPKVHDFFVARKTEVAAAIDAKVAEFSRSHTSTTALVGAAGGPAQHKGAVDAAAEKTHWLLAKIADHHAGSPPAKAPAVQPAPASFGALLAAIQAHVSDDPTVMTALKQAGDAIHQAFATPAAAPVLLLDALLLAAKAAIVAGLDVLDSVSQALLAALADAVTLMNSIVTQTWELPFVGALWRWLTKAGPNPGPQDALNALNVVALIGAIPATVASLLITGDPPFAPKSHAAVPRFVDSPTAPPPPPDPDAGLKRSWGFAAGGLALATSVLTAVLDIQAVEITKTSGPTRRPTKSVEQARGSTRRGSRGAWCPGWTLPACAGSTPRSRSLPSFCRWLAPWPRTRAATQPHRSTCSWRRGTAAPPSIGRPPPGCSTCARIRWT